MTTDTQGDDDFNIYTIRDDYLRTTEPWVLYCSRQRVMVKNFIRREARIGMRESTIYTMPIIIPGLPAFPPDRTAKWLVAELKSLHFRDVYLTNINPIQIHISWKREASEESQSHKSTLDKNDHQQDKSQLNKLKARLKDVSSRYE